MLALVRPAPAEGRAATSVNVNFSDTSFIRPYARHRLFSVSSSAPMARVLNDSPRARATTVHLTRLMVQLDVAVQRALNAARNRSMAALPTCNNRDQPWNSGSSNYITHRGWPLPEYPTCVTDVHGLPAGIADKMGLSVAGVHELIVKRGLSVDARASAIVAAAAPNWTHAEFPVRHAFARGRLRCSVDHLPAFRLGGLWHIGTQVTNRDRGAWVADWKRAYLDEYLRPAGPGDDTLVAATMTLPPLPGMDDRRVVRTDATTVVARWAGATHPSQFYSMQLEDNDALRDALEAGDHFVQQVQDAMAASNVAILALPLVLNLVPVAVVADVRWATVVWFAVLSDVLTALPMVIKGAELIKITRSSFAGMVTRMADPTKDARAVAVPAEVWVAECRVKGAVRPTGVVFVAVGVGMMLLGISLEVWARWWLWGCSRKWLFGRVSSWEHDESFLAMVEGVKLQNDHIGGEVAAVFRKGA